MIQSILPAAALLPHDIESELNCSPTAAQGIFRTIHRRQPRKPLSRSFTEIAHSLRETRVTRVMRSAGSGDGTVKLQVATADELIVETVLLSHQSGPDGNRRTACLSTQAGCAVGCTFCYTGTLGLARSLSAAEIVEQYVHLAERYGPPENVVFMGMGEPLANFDALLNAIAVLAHPLGRAVSFKHITISTSGLPGTIRRLAEISRFTEDSFGRPGLAVSLVTACRTRRQELMPRSASLEKLRAALAYYNAQTGKPVTLELVLLDGVTDRSQDVENLVAFVTGNVEGARTLPLNARVNLITWNPVADAPFLPTPAEHATEMAGALRERGLSVTYRQPRGQRVLAGCGQLGSALARRPGYVSRTALMRRTP